ncbi:MAG: TetR/AcrR family transcriptional regulator [Polyangiales bacterium]
MARPASDIRERISTAARTRFLIEGVDGASLRQIAKDAGTNIGMVYYYFKAKDDLFHAVVEDVYRGLLADIEQILGAGDTEEARFRALYERLAKLSDEEFDVIRLVLREALVSSTRLRFLGELFIRGHIPVVLQALGGGVVAERLRGDVSPVLLMAASLILGFMPQVAHRIFSTAITTTPAGQSPHAPLAALAAAADGGGIIPSADQVARKMADILFHGIAAPSADGKPPDRA